MTADETSSTDNQLRDEGSEIAALETQFDIVRYMRRKCEEYGLKFFIVFNLPGFEAEKLSAYSIVSNWPQEILAKYDALRMVRHSAGIRKLRLTTVPFSYDMREWIGESSEQTDFSELLDVMTGHGMLNGHFFPVHDALGNRQRRAHQDAVGDLVRGLFGLAPGIRERQGSEDRGGKEQPGEQPASQGIGMAHGLGAMLSR